MSKGFRFNGKFKWVIWRWLVQNGAVPGKKLSIMPKDEILWQHLVWLDEPLRSRAVAVLGVALEGVKRGKKPKTTPKAPKAVKAQPDWNKPERERFFLLMNGVRFGIRSLPETTGHASSAGSRGRTGQSSRWTTSSQLQSIRPFGWQSPTSRLQKNKT